MSNQTRLNRIEKRAKFNGADRVYTIEDFMRAKKAGSYDPAIKAQAMAELAAWEEEYFAAGLLPGG